MDRRLKYLWGGVLGSLILLLPLFMRNQVISIEEDEEISLRVDYELNQQLKELEDRLEIKRGVEVGLINGIILVNKEYPVPKNYYKGVDPKAKNKVDKMLQAAREEAGFDLIIHSAYRSYNTQKTLYNNYVRRNGYDRASMYSAKPGHSEHETGLAFDICDRARKYYLKQAFGDSEEGIWLRENAHRFGFILRYPKDKTHITGYIYEPWHFRYVGEEHAKKIYEKDITLEEYLEPDRY